VPQICTLTREALVERAKVGGHRGYKDIQQSQLALNLFALTLVAQSVDQVEHRRGKVNAGAYVVDTLVVEEVGQALHTILQERDLTIERRNRRGLLWLRVVRRFGVLGYITLSGKRWPSRIWVESGRWIWDAAGRHGSVGWPSVPVRL
jgi:hypothetical protein